MVEAASAVSTSIPEQLWQLARGDSRHVETRAGEPWGTRLYLALAAVVIVTASLTAYGITTWPMADDEVPSLVELGLLHNGAERFFSVPPAQIPKLPKATIVWNSFQRGALRLLPAGEVSYRIPGLICGILASAFVFVCAARWRGLWYASALAILLNGSQAFIYLMPLNRFYGLPFLLLVLAMAAMCWPRGGIGMLALTAVLTALTVLSHNVTVAVFALAFIAAAMMYALGRAPLSLVLRSGTATVVGVLIYFFYLLPIVRGWSSTGNPTPVLVSFSAHAGIPALALAFVGCWISLVRPDQGRFMLWWALMFVGSFFVFVLTSITWNPRYFLFFMPAMWIVGAHAMEFIARRVGFRSIGIVWYAGVAALLLPSLASHLVDGSRHDYRTAASVLIANDRQQRLILSDDAETISYYLPADLIEHLEVRTRVTNFPPDEFYLVCRANAWMPLCEIPGRRSDLLAEIYHRRFDQFSHILRVYRIRSVKAAEGDKSQP
jgi:hypothetical protein